MTPVILVLNAGSSSLKFQVFEAGAVPRLVFRGLYEGLGGAARFSARSAEGAVLDEASWAEAVGHEQALIHLVDWLRLNKGTLKLSAVGHRVVHGGEAHAGPALVDDAVLAQLDKLVALAPLHQPHNLKPIRIVRRELPELPQVACFDTAFHRSQPEIAQMLALPREMRQRGVRRYGFHGLSYDYVASVMGEYDARLPQGRVIVAHLGNGASLCALKAGVSVATTMGFSALEGLPMGTRCGAVDPGVIFYMLREMRLTPEEAERTLYTKSGLLGVSGASNDMRVLRASASTNADARLAIDLFVYALIFTAGIGENDAATRAEVIEGLAWAGLALDHDANGRGGPLITSGKGPSAWVVPTNEELVIARQVQGVLSRRSTPARNMEVA